MENKVSDVKLDLNELYRQLCPICQAKFEQLLGKQILKQKTK